MRMWMADPAKMCRKHLLGEHVELHMFVGSVLKGVSLEGYAERGLVEPEAFWTRHAALVAEMQGRGYKHASPLYDLSLTQVLAMPERVRNAKVDPAVATAELCRRCPDCRARHAEVANGSV